MSIHIYYVIKYYLKKVFPLYKCLFNDRTINFVTYLEKGDLYN